MLRKIVFNVLILAALESATTAGAGTCAVDTTQTNQIIRGFGAASAWNAASNLSPYASTLWANDNVNGHAGLSMMRTRIDPTDTGSGSAWNSEAGPMTLAKSVNPNITIWSTEWSPPATYKGNNSVDGGGSNGSLNSTATFLGAASGSPNSADTGYAGYLTRYIQYIQSKFGVSLYAVSCQNEPDWDPTYEAAIWNAGQFDVFTGAFHSALSSAGLSTKIIITESFGDRLPLAATTMDDATNAPFVSIIAGHIYGGGPNALSSGGFTHLTNQDNWETEISDVSGAGPDNSMTSGLTEASWLYKSIVNANMNAFHHWWIWGSDNSALITSSGVSKKLMVIGQYSKFVRPGFYRMGATASPSSGVSVASFKSDSTSSPATVVVVAINGNSSTTSQTFSFTGVNVTSVTPWVTDANNNLVQQAAVAVSGNSFTYSLTGSSVTSFVGVASSTGSNTSTPTFTPTHTNTPVPPTSTPTRTATSTPTSTFTLTHTNTPVPPTMTFTTTPTASSTATATKTNTPVPPTATFTATGTATSTKTNTPLPPTMTFTPTTPNTASSTATATKTNSPVPPTATNTPLPPTLTFTSTAVPPTSTGTAVPPTTTSTPVPPTATDTLVPPTSTFTSTAVPPTMTDTALPPTFTNTPVPPTATSTAVPPTATPTSVPPTLTFTGTPIAPTPTPTPIPPTSTLTAVPSTATNTPVPPTATFTPTSTHTPTPPTATDTPTAVISSTSFEVQLLSGVTSTTTNSPHPFIQVVNTGTGPLNLNSVTVKYWFNCDCTNQTLQVWVDWAGLITAGTSETGNVHATVQPTSLGGQTDYVLYSFTGNLVLQPGQTIQIQSRFNKSDWSNMTQSNDWSFAPNTSYVNASQMTGYMGGSLVWGQEPVAKPAALSAASAVAFPNPSTGSGTTLSFTLNGNAGGAGSSLLDADHPLLLDPNAKITLSIYSLSWRLIWTQSLTGGSYGTTGEHELYWDEKDIKGTGLANGIYMLRVMVESNGQKSSTISKIMILR